MVDEAPKVQPAARPLVSVICRTTGRPQLAAALASIAGQTHRPLELVVVDALGRGLQTLEIPDAGLQVTRVSTGAPLDRARAANQGLDASRGEFLMLLDEDDWIAPRHIEGLLACLQSNNAIKAAYSTSRKAGLDGELREQLFDQPFDPVLLKRDNYIPIHAMLFEASLVRLGCRFDESFDDYEDWDFWLQLARHTAFAHLPVCSAFYREGGTSNTAVAEHGDRYDPATATGKARARLYSKWMPLWSGEELNQLVRLLDETDRISRLDRTIAGLDRTIADLHEQLRDTSRQLSIQHEVTRRQQDQLDALQGSLRDTGAHLQHSQEHERQLEQELRRVHESISWRVTGPLRRLGRFLQKLFRRQ